jgi:heparin binding hemagglutinin HbhA
MARTKFDIKTEAQRTIHAGVGAADLAIATVKDVVTDAQKRLAEAQKSVKDLDLKPRAIRSQASTRRDAVEKRVAELQTEAQKLVFGNVEAVTETYDELVERGRTVVRKFRNKPATKQTVANAKTTTAKARTTTTQAKKTAKKSPATSSAKATGTAAKKTVKSAAKAVSS